MKDLIFKWFLGFLERILSDLVDDGKINGSVKAEILKKITE
ncbi:hypothetical protein [Chryseobacterium indoltheticum]|uniref:Uncharacterized protein n=1 Tax=Chryseobacterium indoltheticum TaxID=254 RepID=A0A381FGF2_9FLAO|nr:hypothetical protein [Chryseobacterium indoltheticum]SIQ08561.1 hypothetical protein SAMN05421682_102293 [Chryseobacterium indoltheticum]SUX45563.1 Uncharacterised protein [Chryseobacterium indoltheticum]